MSNYNLLDEGKVRSTLLCDQCDYATKNKSNLIFHMKQKHDEVNCVHCDFTGKGRALLVQHTKASHPEAYEDMTREKSEKKEKSWRNFKHVNFARVGRKPKLKTADNVKVYSCDKCEYQSKNLNLLKRHLRDMYLCSLKDRKNVAGRKNHCSGPKKNQGG